MAERNLEIALRMRADMQQARRQLQQVERDLEGVGDEGDRTARSMDGFQSSLNGVRTIAVAVGGAIAAMGLGSIARDTYSAISSAQSLRASLKTVTGSVENANAAWDQLLAFASETPFTLDQSVQAFIRMKSLGLNPTQEALRSFGNTASAMGQDMMQMVEAVADASTGEFERLKAFGIRASREGEQITFTFQGVQTTVANTAEAITGYLEKIGNNQFAGAMADQMDTLGGKASNLQDTIYQLYLAIGDAGATEVFGSGLDAASGAAEALTENVDGLVDIAQIGAAVFAGHLTRALATAAGAKLAATQQAVAYQAALARMAGVSRTAAVAQTTLAGATRAATGAMALLGGPVGAAVVAAGALYVFREELGLTGRRIGLTEGELASLRAEMQEMSGEDLGRSLDSLNAALDEATLKAAAAREELAKLRSGDRGSGVLGFGAGEVGQEVRGLQAVAEATQRIAEIEDRLAVAREERRRRTEGEDPEKPSEPESSGSASGRSAAAREYEAALQALQNLDQRLQQQIATFGEGEAAVLEYRLSLGDLADDVARLGAEGQALAASIVEQAREIERLTEVEERRAEAEQQRRQAQQLAEQNLQQILDQANPTRGLERQLELIEELRRQFPEYAVELGEAAGQVRSRIDDINNGLLSTSAINAEFAYGATEGLMSFAEDIASGKDAVDSLGDAFRRFAADFLRYIAQMIMQQAVFNALQAMGGGSPGGIVSGLMGALGLGGGGGGGGGGIYANVAAYHSGGIAGQGALSRKIPASAFVSAPRYHTGGMAGLAPDEVPAILRRGEEVLTDEDPRHRNNGGDQQNQRQGITIINTFNADEAFQAGVSTPLGQKALFNVMRQRRSELKAILD